LRSVPSIRSRHTTPHEVCMPRDPQVLIFVGIKNAVVALDDRTGAEVWRAELHSSDYVTVLWDGEALLAANAGEVWRLDPARGGVLWHNDLKGMGRGLVSLASSRRPTTTTADADLAAEKRRRDAAASAATGAA
jgi:outer membrane protein assembly factor BamB